MVRTTSKQTGPWEEKRRFRAWELSQQGWSQVEIAEALGVDQSTISRWLARAEAHGAEGLRTRKREGPKPRLSAEQRARLLDEARLRVLLPSCPATQESGGGVG